MIFLILLPLFVSNISFYISKLLIFILNFKSNEKDIQNDNKSELPMYPIQRIVNMKIRSIFSNNNLFRVMLLFCISIPFIAIEYEQGKTDAENLKDHICVTTIDNTNYAIIAQDSDNIIVERIDIKDEKATTATVYCNEQILIPKKNIEMKVYSFEKVVPREKDDEDMTEEDTA